MNAVPASAAYAASPQNAVGRPNSVAQRLDKTMSQLLPTAQPFTELPVHSVHDRYEASPMPISLKTSSGQFGAALIGCWIWTTIGLFASLFAFAFLPMARKSTTR